MKKLLLAGVMLLALAACERPADVASRNLSMAADNFQVARKITFINGITGQTLLTITGLCSLGNNDSARTLSVTCKTPDGQFVKHFLGLSDNVSFISEQIEAKAVSVYQYKVVFNPLSIIPDVDMVN